jgi:hypothetical protein
MNQFDTSYTEDDGDLWHVQLRTGEVRAMTLDQLDDAFQRGIVNEDTYVFQEDANQWARLGEVAGLDADADEPDSAPASSGYSGYSPPAGYAQFTGGSSGYPLAVGPNSTAPVATEIDDFDFDTGPSAFRKKKSGATRWIAAAAVLGAIGYGATKMDKLSALGFAARGVAAQSLVATTPPQAAPPPPAVTPPPPAADTAPKPAPPESRFSDDQKKALMEADKARAEAHAEKLRQVQQHRREAAPRKSPRPTGPAPFRKGGSPHDPLNSTL